MIYRFDRFELDMARFELRDDGAALALEPQVFALLAFLVERRDRLVPKDEIFEKLWDGRVVTDSALTSRIKSARQALGDSGKAQRFIKTIHGKGFRFVGDVRFAHGEGVALPGEDAERPDVNIETSPRPSIAVLPFRSHAAAGRYDTLAEGLAHELITELARLRWLLVIARGSSFRFRDPDLDLREVGRLLGVRYCLSGDVETSGQELVVTTELSDTRTGEVVWGERYAGHIGELHAVRAEIKSKILMSLEIQIPLHEAAGARLISTDNLDAWSAYHLGLQHLYRYTRNDNATATELFEHAVKQDENFARAHAGLSFVHFQTAFMRQTDDIPGEIALARSCAQRGLDIDPLDPFANFTMGRSYWLETDLDSAQSWLERATSLSPNYAQGLYALAWTKTIAGADQDGREQLDLAMRLSPLDPLYYAMLGARGFTHIAEGEYAEAAIWTDKAARSPGAHVFMAVLAAVAQSLAGNKAQAAVWAADVRERGPFIRSADFFRGYPVRAEPMRSRIADALRELGF
ncbi:MAG: winged helix-turn-helix domain-containing protein [Gammaproteobacteria bacterium]|nr:winged helix-turn-helix domain-containing protein [Gammaproteobacteria bacterium]NNF49796.1 transcriptional regulator [Woeseiaceae bacterium]MBT8094060.1 winged helix-turn-helix domain-containing protein [Gammaproteobacteria bacterium]MBT8105719.1 winged helix-turn-helix domain-containing protein [Gammaproteobacteria bacterium]NNK25733.1 transcriptional regulator [Woeseiaceae bacterium]